MKINDNCQIIFKKLEAAGKEAYLVGGCVRDHILGKEPHDYDFTTNATPEEIVEIFADHHLILVGADHGVITVSVNGEHFEVATYRDNSLEGDLSKRDFSINAMAYNPKIGIIDPFNGQEDIESKTIKAVGNANERFQEDPIRIIRALRFSSQLGFDIDKITEESMQKNCMLMAGASKERYTAELVKLMSTEKVVDTLDKYWNTAFANIPELLVMNGFNQNNPHHIYDLKGHTLEAIRSYEGDSTNAKIALLLHDIGKPVTQTFEEDRCRYFNHNMEGQRIAKNLLETMRFSSSDIKEISTLVKYHDLEISSDEKLLKKWIAKLGEPTMRSLIDIEIADAYAQNPELATERLERVKEVKERIDDVVKSMSAFSKKDLVIGGRELLEIGLQGREIGETLDKMFEMITDGKLQNTKESLTDFLKEIKQERETDIVL